MKKPSSIFFLPLISKQYLSVKTSGIVPLTYILHSYIKTSYVYFNEEEAIRYLYLEFDKWALDSKIDTLISDPELLYLLMIPKTYGGIAHKNGTYLFRYLIPTHYKNDIGLISQGKYSKTSGTYKARMLYDECNWIMFNNNKSIQDFYRANTAYRIVTRCKKLKEMIIDEFFETPGDLARAKTIEGENFITELFSSFKEFDHKFSLDNTI